MKSKTPAVAVVTFIVGAMLGLMLSQWNSDWPTVAHAQPPAPRESDQLAALQVEVERLKKIVPDQAHAMQDVDYHFTNLWFAANQGHWPLAQFYFNETRSHLRWAVRIIPARKDNQGQEVKLEDILQAIENTPLKELEDAIKSQDREKFVAAYEFTLTSCYSCHKTSDKPFLRPRIPEHPATSIINFDPKASWPQ
jgi:hypothetical protein